MGAPLLRIQVLGPLAVRLGPRLLDVGPARQQAVLAALVLRPGKTVSRQRLLDDIWGSDLPGSGDQVITGYVYRLRESLGPGSETIIESVSHGTRFGYRFNAAGIELDHLLVDEMAAGAARAAEAENPPEALRLQTAALGLFRGEPLDGLQGPYLEGQRIELTGRRIALAVQKSEWLLRLDRSDEAVGELSDIAEDNPHNEPLAAALMRALAANDRRADAVAVFDQLQRRLDEDLGTEPGENLRHLRTEFVRDGHTRNSSGVHPIAGQTVTNRRRPIRNELPPVTGELIGRNRELGVLTDDHAESWVRVDAIDGVAGVGKTALVQQVAHHLLSNFPDGCLFVDLHGHTEGRTPVGPQQALRRMLRAVGTDDSGIPDDLDELTASWRSATALLRLLVVLDNAASAEQVRHLLPTGPGSRVLVTSRARLTGLDVHRRVSLAPLSLPAAEELLRRIVEVERPGREPEEIRTLARFCGRLPLAMRIAGSRLQTRPDWQVSDLIARLEADDRRLGELDDDSRGVAAALRLSVDQLPDAGRRTFELLGLIPTVEFDQLAVSALLAVGSYDAERSMQQLVDTSLLQEPVGGRYRMHDLVALFARQLAAQVPDGATTEARERLLRLYLWAGRQASDWGVAGFPTGPVPTGSAPSGSAPSGTVPTGPVLDELPFANWAAAASWLDAVDSELVKVIAAAAAAGRADFACWIAESLVDYLVRKGRFHECRSALELTLPLAAVSGDDRMTSSLRTCLGVTWGYQGRLDQARTWFKDALRISQELEDPREEARALGGLGSVAALSGEAAEALGHLTRVVDLARQLDDSWLAGMAICNIGMVHHHDGQLEAALDCFSQALVLAERLNSSRLISKTLCYIGLLQLDVDQHEEARATLHRAEELAVEADDVQLVATSLTRRAEAEARLGDPAAARELHRRALDELTDQTAPSVETEIRQRLGQLSSPIADVDATAGH